MWKEKLRGLKVVQELKREVWRRVVITLSRCSGRVFGRGGYLSLALEDWRSRYMKIVMTFKVYVSSLGRAGQELSFLVLSSSASFPLCFSLLKLKMQEDPAKRDLHVSVSCLSSLDHILSASVSRSKLDIWWELYKWSNECTDGV